MNNAYSIIVVPADHSGTRQYTVTKLLIWTAALLFTLLLVTMIVFLATYSQVLARARQVDEIALENQRLRSHLATIEELGKELEDLISLKAQILLMLGVESQEPLLTQSEAGASGAMRVATLELMGLDHMKAAESLQSFAPRRWPVEGYVSKEFFLEEDESQGHPGLDLVAPLGASVVAAGRGRVIEARYDAYLGNYTILDHGFGFTSVYAHNERLLVSEGQRVDQGQAIALLGNTGESSAPHLHFEVRIDGQAVDPKQYLGPQ